MKIHYKTLKELANQSTRPTYIPFKVLLSNKGYHKKHGYCTMVLNEEEKEKEIIKMVDSVLGGWTSTRERIKRHLLSGRVKDAWYFSRLYYSKKDNKWHYCAGQEYIGELQAIRNELK